MNKPALPGQRFGRLTVTEVVGSFRKCVCDCGTKSTVDTRNLVSGNTQSCGCFRREVEVVAGLTHGATSNKKWSRAYNTWHGMLQRCFNPNNPSWDRYGGRGITVCAEWRNSFSTFLSDMGEPPTGRTLERLNNDGHYSKDNCVWATNTQQARNKANNRMITYKGETKSLAQWCADLGIPYFTVHKRLRLGWSDEQALSKEARRV